MTARYSRSPASWRASRDASPLPSPGPAGRTAAVRSPDRQSWMNMKVGTRSAASWFCRQRHERWRDTAKTGHPRSVRRGHRRLRHAGRRGRRASGGSNAHQATTDPAGSHWRPIRPGHFDQLPTLNSSAKVTCVAVAGNARNACSNSNLQPCRPDLPRGHGLILPIAPTSVSFGRSGDRTPR